MRTDGGPQFRSEFKEWCNNRHIVHELSCPYNPQSNGHAESAVKQAKYLLQKCNNRLDDFQEALFEWRNTPRADGVSPSDLFFGRRLRSSLPTVRRPGVSPSYAEVLQRRKKENTQFPAVPPGTPATLQDPHTKRWDERASILKPRRADNRSYTVRTEDGQEKMRTDRHIRFDKNVQIKLFRDE